MKTFLITVALFAAVASATPKTKRDVSHLLKENAQYLPPKQHYRPQLNNQYLAPVKQSLQLPSTSYGVPFNSAPATASAAALTSYGTPVVNYASVPVVHQAPIYQASVPVVHQAPVYQAPVYQAPAPVVHQAPVYQAPVYQASAPVVHQAPVYQVPAQVVTYEQVPTAPIQHYQQGTSYNGFSHSQHQQNIGSNGGYVY